jgi:hypothetical protein
MTFNEEQALKEALRNGDGRLMADTVKRMNFADYDEIERFVSDQPGGYRHVSYRGIECGDVRIKDEYGRPRVEER